jgi:hypothetical protein
MTKKVTTKRKKASVSSIRTWGIVIGKTASFMVMTFKMFQLSAAAG